MALKSDPRFRVHHAVRIKGMAAIGHLVDLSGVEEHEVTSGLSDLHGRGLAKLFESRGLWSLTPAGREAHAVELENDAGRAGFRDGLAKSYPRFLELNVAFKVLCGDWQLRDGAPNDHADSSYDKRIVNRLATLDGHTQTVAKRFGDTAETLRAVPPTPQRGPLGLRRRADQHVHRCAVRVIPRRVDGTARRSDPHPKDRSACRRQLLAFRRPTPSVRPSGRVRCAARSARRR